MTSSINYSLIRKRKQQGVILLVALIMLLIMTGVGVTLMSGATLQERLAGNTRQLSTARINAESALRRGEQYIQDLNVSNINIFLSEFVNNSTSTVGHYYPIVPSGTYITELEAGFDINVGTAWGSGNSREVVLSNTDLSALSSRFIVEYIGTYFEKGGKITSLDQEVKLQEDTEPFVFRITAIGYGKNQNIYSVLQSIYMTQQGNQ